MQQVRESLCVALSLECGSDFSVQLITLHSFQSNLEIIRLEYLLHYIFAPAPFNMLAHVSSGSCIPCVEEPLYSCCTTLCITSADMQAAPPHVLNSGAGLEKGIDR